ncbi:hypothetical protein M430DRAFT_125540 [Amorphotheca resinae ATCC 22711]|uniref:CENP-V/GFA domain-containing protein n=1 Tax=Amorphotheca resinae ATCC 22711 TaxID=857342 RepID=A0A2T3AU23_AMORE|nr:hypothetical protein M430DRAFT_125540 [Amorphotheca resinae ATCC 22711]PSS12167.1 hypothetical protein M430DRAFT_125540 [Amorphotheca resinae ATCC 22711]
MEGTCLCGAVRVEVKDDNLFGGQRRGHVCHCTNCRKTAGTAAATNLLIESDKVVLSGEHNLKEYIDTQTLSGTPLSRYFCFTCGNPIKSVTSLYPGKVILKLGIFPKIPVPEWESFASQRQSWEKPIDGCVQYKTKSLGEELKIE